MPFIMVHSFARDEESKRALVKGVTEATCSAFQVEPGTVSVYIQDYQDVDYGHAGKLGREAAEHRSFIQVHALPRSVDLKRTLVKAITDVVVSAYGVAAKSVVVYVFDSEKHDCAHGGVLISDGD
jgi:phenylpyruvate tautomerase PptA (4-oxalocrotonate tautomerase family)